MKHRDRAPLFTLARCLASAAVLLTVSWPAEAQYIGREDERLLSFVVGDEAVVKAGDRTLEAIGADLEKEPRPELWEEKGALLSREGQWKKAEEAFRRAASSRPTALVGQAVAQFKQGKGDQALELVGSASREDNAFRYLRVLLTLQTEKELDLDDLREDLYKILETSPYYRDVFDVWLGFNPDEDQLEDYHERMAGRPGAEAVWQRSEVLLRLDEPERLLREELGKLDPQQEIHRGLWGRIERVRARAYFQMDSDGTGQTYYRRILTRLDDEVADLLYRDLAATASTDGREEYAELTVEEKPDFFRKFWKRRHPVPVEDVNPRLGEHYRRLATALSDYPLDSNGRGYFTHEEVLHQYSPELDYYDPKVFFDNARASRYWLDHRGLMLIRHGEADRRLPPQSHGGADRSEMWLFSQYQSRPLMFNFVRRDVIDEWIVVLNLGVAATSFAGTPDDPEEVWSDLESGYRALYQSRAFVHSVYRQVLEARTRQDVRRALQQESQLMSAFAKAAFTFDSTDYYNEDNTLPISVSASNFYEQGQPGMLVNFAADFSEIDRQKLSGGGSLQATVILYDEDWKEELYKESQTFPVQQPPEDDDEAGYVGSVPMYDLDPMEYRMVLQVYQPETGRIGIARGRHAVIYVPPDGMGVSSLLLQQRVAGDESKPKEERTPWLPAPGRVVHEAKPFRVDFELYNLEPDEDGTVRYEIEERVLTLQEDPGFLDHLLGYANVAGQMFFPVYTFAAQVGAFTLNQALASETAGLEVATRKEERKVGDPSTVEETIELLDFNELEPGTHTMYITVRDLNSGEVTSEFVTFRLAG